MPRRFTDIPDHRDEPTRSIVRGFWDVLLHRHSVSAMLLGLVTGLDLDRLAVCFERASRAVGGTAS